MKHFITLISIIILSFSTINVYGQEEQSKEIVDRKIITSNCTITKPIKYLCSPELNIDGILKDGVYIIINFVKIGNGGRCEVTVRVDDQDITVNRWVDYDNLAFIRIKQSNGQYGYALKNDMFYFFTMFYLDSLEGYAFDSTLEEID